jgi:uncharacterized protein YdaU (DUF1376 family)
MADFPALPLWTDAYLADTSHFSHAEHGCYLLLLMTMWRAPECRLPNDDQFLARRFNLSVDDIKAQFRPLIVEFCQSTGNWITQKRLTRERAYVSARTKKRSDAAKLRWNKGKGSYNADAPTPTPTPTVESKNSVSSLRSETAAPAPFEGRQNEEQEAPKPGPQPPPDLWKAVYDLGRPLIGAAQTTKLRRHCNDDAARSLDLLRLAEGKSDPREYVGAILRGDAGARADDVLAETERLYRDLGVS